MDPPDLEVDYYRPETAFDRYIAARVALWEHELQRKGMMPLYNERGLPFSKWKPADKFKHVFAETWPDLWEHCREEYEFSDARKWRMDFAWTTLAIAVEIDGFGYGHQAQQGMAEDNEKANRAVVLGWRILRYNSRQLGSRAGVDAAVDQVASLICGAM